MVKRYTVPKDSFIYAKYDGLLVEYADYAALEARVAELEGKLSDAESDIDTIAEHNIELYGKVAELEKDAARYRWLRDSDNYPTGPYWNNLGNTCEPEEMDEMIDEAMSRET